MDFQRDVRDVGRALGCQILISFIFPQPLSYCLCGRRLCNGSAWVDADRKMWAPLCWCHRRRNSKWSIQIAEDGLAPLLSLEAVKTPITPLSRRIHLWHAWASQLSADLTGNDFFFFFLILDKKSTKNSFWGKSVIPGKNTGGLQVGNTVAFESVITNLNLSSFSWFFFSLWIQKKIRCWFLKQLKCTYAVVIS